MPARRSSRRGGALARVRPDDLAARWSPSWSSAPASTRRTIEDLHRSAAPSPRASRAERRPARRLARRPAAVGRRARRSTASAAPRCRRSTWPPARSDGRRRGLRLRRRRDDEPGADDGLQPDAQPGAGRALSRRPTSRMGETAENVARKFGDPRERAGGVRASQSQRKAAAARRPTAGSRTRSCRSTATASVDSDGCIRAGHQPRGPGRAEAGVRRRRHGHRRHLFAADRRRRGGAGLLRGRTPTRTGCEPLARGASDRGRRLRAGDHGHRPGRGHAARRWSAPASSVDDIDVVELNEAFASQALACVRELGIDPSQDQPRRRRDRARPSARRDRRAHHRQGRRAAAARGQALRAGDAVHRRRPGHRHHAGGACDRDPPGGGDRRRHDGRGHRRADRQCRRAGGAARPRRRRCGRGRGAAEAKACAAGRSPDGGQDHHRRARGRSRSGGRCRLDRRGDHRGSRRQAGALHAARAVRKPGSIVSLQHLHHPAGAAGRRSAGRPRPRLHGHPLLQPAALHAAAGDRARADHSARGRRRDRGLRRRPAWERPSCAATTRRASSPTGSASTGSPRRSARRSPAGSRSRRQTC